MKNVNDYGRFIKEERCFELTSEPPRKWVNVHYNEIAEKDDGVELYAEITNIGDGQMFARMADGSQVQLVAYDRKYIYIRDEETGEVFCPAGEPSPTPVENYKCKFFAHKTEISSEYKGVKVKQRVFVPRPHNFEAHTLTLNNTSDKKKKYSIFAFAGMPIVVNMADGRCEDSANTLTKRIKNGVLAKNRAPYLDRGYCGFMLSLNDIKGASGYRDFFTRSDFSLNTPRIFWGWNCDERYKFGPDCAAILQVEMEVEPGKEGRADFLLGFASNEEEALNYGGTVTKDTLDAMALEQEEIENKRADMFTIDVGNENYNGIINNFVKKQLYSYLINKSGFRDNLQTDMALALCDYDAALDNVYRAMSSEYISGVCPHSFRPHNPEQYADKPAWPLMVVPSLIKERGDYSILDKQLPYYDSEEKDSLLDHLIRIVRFMVNDTGVNGLSDNHYADWNDGLAALEGTAGRESVMVSEQLCYGLLEMIELAEKIGKDYLVKEFRGYYDDMKKKINDVAWDGDWYVRILSSDGFKVGSKAAEEGKIFMNSQSWAVLSKVAEGERAEKAMAAVDKYIEKEVGFSIVDPPYTKVEPRVGDTSTSMPGKGENGGCYNHASGFKGVADCVLNRNDEAWRTFVKVTPGSPDNPIEQSEAEPFSYTNFYNTVDFAYGESGYPWRTGTAAWFTHLIVEWILGARRHYDGLLIDPHLPSSMPKASIKRTFREAVYNISIENESGKGSGVKKLIVDGKELDGTIIPPFEKGEHEVKVSV